MGYNQAYSAYQKTNITTASQGKLVVLLYEACIKNLRAALALLDSEDKIRPGDIENYSKFIQQAQSTITELEVSLAMNNGGEIAKSLMSLYLFFNSELTDVTFRHSSKKIKSIIDMMNELLSAWRTAANSTANAPASTSMQQSSISIEG